MKRNMRKLLILGFLVLSLLAGSFAGAENGFVIPPELTVIAESTFENVPLQDAKVELPEKVRRIEAKAFAGTGLKTLRLGTGITYIADNAFDGCPSFRPEVYPDSYAAEWCASHGVTPCLIVRPEVTAHTAAQIRSFVGSHPVEFDSVTQYRKNPTGGEYGGSIYDYGLIADASMTNGLNMVNIIRYVAGLNADVVNASDMEDELAASALVNALNKSISHSPARPDALSDSRYDELYAKARTGGGSSNLFMGPRNLADSVLGYMDDSDSSNLDRVGHRRWILNPKMGKTTFGFCHSTQTYTYEWGSYTYNAYYSGLYAFDSSGSGNQKMVAWPAQQTPVSYFRANSAWSVSYGTSLNMDLISVTLVREQDGAVWNFSSAAADGFFNVDNGGYGQTGCVIFRPQGLSVSAGDSFRVSIRDDGHNTLLEYRVVFFSL